MSDSEQPDDSQKTEEPTSKKLEEARKKGQVPLSREVNNWLMLLAGTILVLIMSGPMFVELTYLMRTYIEQAHLLPSLPGGMSELLGGTFFEVLAILFVPLLFLMVAAVAGPLFQVGPLFQTETMKPKLEKISVLKGAKRMFSQKSLMEFLKGVLKIALIAFIGFILIYPFFGGIDHVVGLSMPTFMLELKSLILRMMIGILIVTLVIAVIDLVFQRQQHYKQMRMTRQEVKDEYRQAEGDPHVRAKLRQLRSERSRQRMMQAVPEADVVITNPTHFAVALQYKPELMEAPKCVAKGQDNVALRIREVAKEHDIIIYENPPLARSLFDVVDIDQTIPPEQYKAVAEVISFVFKQKGKLK